MLKVENSSDSNSQETQTREPISIFQEIAKAEDQSKKQNLKDLLEKLKSFYSDDLKIGVALKTGDCFFDSVAQGLNELKDKVLVENSERFNVKSLRKDCADYARENNDKDSWIYKKVIKDAEDYLVPQKNVVFPHLGNIKDEKGNDAPDVQETFNKYLDYIKNVATENGPIPIWGRPEIEGLMISNKYDVVLYFYSTSEKNGQKITVTKITPGSDDPEVFIEGENFDQLHKDSNDSNEKVVRIVNYRNHFVPLLSNLEEDIEGAILVSREEVYGIADEESPSLIEDIKNYDLEEGAEQQSQAQNQSNRDSLQGKIHLTATDIFKRLEKVQFNSDDSGNPQTWSDIDRINSFMNSVIMHNGNQLAYYISPISSGFNTDGAIQDALKHICKRKTKDDCIINDHYNNELDKPFILQICFSAS